MRERWDIVIVEVSVDILKKTTFTHSRRIQTACK